MEYRKLGKTDVEVSVLALGCWPFAGGAYWGDQNDKDSIDTVHAALDAGINFFDTAESYGEGHSERVLGQALAGRGDRAIVATKVQPKYLAPDDLIASCERSLRNLQRDYVDLYQIHYPNPDVPLAESIGALSRLREQGKIRAIGVSNFGIGDLTDILALSECVTNQLPFSLLWRAIEYEIQPKCISEGVGILCYSSLAQGLLTGRYSNVDEVPKGLRDTRWYRTGRGPREFHNEDGAEEEVFGALRELRDIVEETGLPMATISLAWAKAQPGISSLLVGARSPEELGWNIPVATTTLEPALLARISAATDAVKTKLGTNADMWMVPSRIR